MRSRSRSPAREADARPQHRNHRGRTMSYNIDIATTEGIPNGMEEENRSDVTEVARIIVDTDMTRTKNDGRVVLLPGAVTDRELRIDIGKTVHHDPPTRERKAIITPAGTMEEVGIPMLYQWEEFVRKWNTGGLSPDWYEPEMILRVIRERSMEEARAKVSATGEGSGTVETVSRAGDNGNVHRTGVTEGMSNGNPGMEGIEEEDEEEDDEDDDYAPPLPPSTTSLARTYSSSKPGPAIPSLEDLELRRALQVEAEEDRLASLRLARRADRSIQKERLDELAPKPDAGSHERKLEKRKAATDMMRQFTSAREGGDIAEVDDKELIGGGDGAEDYRRMLANMQRKKTEREVRREEIARARNAERVERVREYKAKEQETVEMLKELARQRFG
ncbi:hypothetical protein DL546_009356 [Coniochaeta pulveracea]|uniref:Uncharacterized protein n=1 Tax=Coniochaeta pulveracea TaxID=177199 RepID=A0A420YLA3_9PEZI|nr:hypothetical protein DL546_009356 [Coniochaeta pulveracea]